VRRPGRELLRIRRKRRAELGWWKRQRDAEGSLHAAHYELLFTRPFDLKRSFFRDRSILDVGCGPRGSLEWADDAAERVGLDPLARRYRALGTGDHRMRYVAGRAEAIPFEDGRFDVVSAFNSLDHVEDERRAAAEIVRVLAPGGVVLLIVEVGHAPSSTEPLTLGWDLTGLFSPPLSALLVQRLEKTGGVNESVLHNPVTYDGGQGNRRPGILVAKLAHSDREPVHPDH
jgi:SAM-dependent methyltransferase